MGMPYGLMKIGKPEIFNLGKGSRMFGGGWLGVFSRSYGAPFDADEGNFHESFTVPVDLEARVAEFDNRYSGDAETVARRIRDWMGDDACLLINYWEELESLIESKRYRYIRKEFADVHARVEHPLSKYRETGSVWKD